MVLQQAPCYVTRGSVEKVGAFPTTSHSALGGVDRCSVCRKNCPCRGTSLGDVAFPVSPCQERACMHKICGVVSRVEHLQYLVSYPR